MATTINLHGFQGEVIEGGGFGAITVRRGDDKVEATIRKDGVQEAMQEYVACRGSATTTRKVILDVAKEIVLLLENLGAHAIMYAIWYRNNYRTFMAMDIDRYDKVVHKLACYVITHGINLSNDYDFTLALHHHDESIACLDDTQS